MQSQREIPTLRETFISKCYRTKYKIEKKHNQKDESGKICSGGVFVDIKDHPIESYNPLDLDEPILNAFMSIDENSESSTLRFVNKYGTLGTRFFYHKRKQHEYDLVEEMQREVNLVKKLMEIYSAVYKEDHERVKEVLWLDEKSSKEKMFDPRLEVLAPTFPFKWRRRGFDEKPVNTRYLMPDREPQIVLEHGLKDDVLAIGAYYLSSILGAYLGDVILWLNYEDSKFEGTNRVEYLVTAIYLQIYMLITDHKTLGTCRGCSNLFVPTRANNEYCTQDCRHSEKQREYRRREKIKRTQ